MADRKACPPQKYESLVTSHIIKEYYIQAPVQGNQNTIKSAIMPLSHTHTLSHTHAGFGGTLHTPPADSTRRAGPTPSTGGAGFHSRVREQEEKETELCQCSPIMYIIPSPSHPIPHTHIRVSEHESLTHIPSHPIPSLCTLAPKIRE